MKIALAFLPSWLPYAPPLGIASISSFVKEKGHDVELFDLNAEIHSRINEKYRFLWDTPNGEMWMEQSSYNKSIHPHISDHLKEKAKVFAFSDFDAIGFSIYSSNYLPTRSLIGFIKKLNPGMKVFLGGPGIDEKLVNKDLLDGLIEGAVFGEGELGVLDLLDYWNGNKKWEDCLGIMAFSAEGQPAKQKPHPLIKLKDLPTPDFSEFNLSQYFGETLPIEFSRGCIANCTFCSETNYWVSFRTKQVEQIVSEFRYYAKTYGVENFRVVDSLMNGNSRFLRQLAERLIEEQLKVNWYGFCRIDPKLDSDLLALLKQAGCSAIIFGLESGSQKVLDLMKKKVQLENQFKVVRETHKNGIKVYGEILVGFPGEGLIDFIKTMKMLLVLRSSIYGVSTGAPMSVVQNSEVYDHPERFGVEMRENGWVSNNGRNNPFTRRVLFKVMNTYVRILGFKI